MLRHTSVLRVRMGRVGRIRGRIRRIAAGAQELDSSVSSLVTPHGRGGPMMGLTPPVLQTKLSPRVRPFPDPTCWRTQYAVSRVPARPLPEGQVLRGVWYVPRSSCAGGSANGVVCGPAAGSRAPRRRPERGPRAADGDQRDPAGSSRARRPTSSRSMTRSSRGTVRLCGGLFSTVIIADGKTIRLGAFVWLRGGRTGDNRASIFRRAWKSDLPSAWVIRERSILHLPDTEDSPYARWARRTGFRSYISLPDVEGTTSAIGAYRGRPNRAWPPSPTSMSSSSRPSPIRPSLPSRTSGSSRSWRPATATSPRRYSSRRPRARFCGSSPRSPTELQPVLDAIATSALRLCAASDVVIERLEGERFYNAAHAGAGDEGTGGPAASPDAAVFPGGVRFLDRKRVIVDDIQLVAET